MSASMKNTTRNITFSRLKYFHSFFCRSKNTWKGKIRKEKQHAYQNTGELRLDNNSVESQTQDLFVPYRKMINERITEANRSLLFQLNERDDIQDVVTCVQTVYGNIKKGFYFPSVSQRKLVLIEFSSSKKFGTLAPSRVKDTSELPTVKGRSLVENIKGGKSLMEKFIQFQPKTYQPDSLKHCNTVSDQLNCLYKDMKMSEAMVRLHFFVGMLVLRTIRNRFPGVQAMFFGSSSCGLALEGKSDLDMLILQDNILDENEVLKPLSKELCRETGLFSNVYHIPHARVPIIKFDAVHTNMSCDLSCNILSGVLMAETLYWLNVYEPMFYPLVIAVKLWGREHHITSSGMGHHFSNHMITMLMLAYLQQEQLLPALKTIYTNTGRGAKSAGVLSTWRNIEFKKPKRNMSKLFLDKDIGSLLLGFFQYYSKFPFQDYIIDVHFGKMIKRPHRYDICVINPHESEHNVCKNVRAIQLDRFQMMCKHSAKVLELNQEKSIDGSTWGLACVLSNHILREKKRSKLFDLDIAFGSNDGDVQEVSIEVGGEDELDVDELHVNRETPAPCDEAINSSNTEMEVTDKTSEFRFKDVDDINYVNIDKCAETGLENSEGVHDQTRDSRKNIDVEEAGGSKNQEKKKRKKKKKKVLI